MPENMGEGYQYPKAVLDAIGKAYIVEFCTSGEDKVEGDNVTSAIYYVIFSNGFVIQCQSMLNRDKTITFPIEFADTKYCLLGVGLDIHQVAGQYYERSATGFTTHSITKGANTRTWIACGYKA